jgi:hypothetical protein
MKLGRLGAGGALEDRSGVRGRGRQQGGQPARRWNTVVVGEGDERRPRQPPANVAPTRRPERHRLAITRRAGGGVCRADPGLRARAVANDALRLFDLGPGHRLQSAIIDPELALPAVLRRSASVSGQVLGVLALIGLAVGLRRRRGLGPWWLWGMPVTALLATVVMVGGRLKRAPLDPFLIVLAALAIDAAAVCVQGAPRSTDKA